MTREAEGCFAKLGAAEQQLIRAAYLDGEGFATLDGHGAVLDGSEPIKPDEWEDLGGGLYRKVKLLPRFDEAMLARWFFLCDGVTIQVGCEFK